MIIILLLADGHHDIAQWPPKWKLQCTRNASSVWPALSISEHHSSFSPQIRTTQCSRQSHLWWNVPTGIATTFLGILDCLERCIIQFCVKNSWRILEWYISLVGGFSQTPNLGCGSAFGGNCHSIILFWDELKEEDISHKLGEWAFLILEKMFLWNKSFEIRVFTFWHWPQTEQFIFLFRDEDQQKKKESVVNCYTEIWANQFLFPALA